MVETDLVYIRRHEDLWMLMKWWMLLLMMMMLMMMMMMMMIRPLDTNLCLWYQITSPTLYLLVMQMSYRHPAVRYPI